jgi:hypothetical protein
VKAYEEAARKMAEGGTAAGDTTDPQIAAQIAQLKAADAAVRAHEAAHIMVGGTHVRSAASYTYQTGPDGKEYAIGGEVAIDTSPVPGNPQATIQKMDTVRAAALAPADPSAADRAVAAAAAQMAAAARAELARQEAGGGASEAAPPDGTPSERTSSVPMRQDDREPAAAQSGSDQAAGAISVAQARQIREAYGASRTSREESSLVFSAAA